MRFSPQRRTIFHISTSKSGPRPSVFIILTWIFQQINCSTSNTGILYIWLGNMLLATALCNFSQINFSTSELTDWLTTWLIFRQLNFKKWSEHAVFCTFLPQNVLLATAACYFWFLLWPHDSAPAALTSLLFDSPDTRIMKKHSISRLL